MSSYAEAQYELAKVDILRQRLESRLGTVHDWLGKYRSWLDRRGIEDERADGWPTDEVYEESNITRFIAANAHLLRTPEAPDAHP